MDAKTSYTRKESYGGVWTEHETDFPHFAPEGNPDKALNGGCDCIDLHPQYLFETLTV